jgi:hypothetical protein
LAEIASIIVALIALSSSVLVAFITYFSNRKVSEANRKSQAELEVLKKRLESKKSEEDARRDYKYEAIRRLYREYQPVLFQLVELSDSALRRIYRLAGVAKEGKLEGWLSDSNNYFTKTTAYRLIAPLAACKILRSKLTLVDINADPTTTISFQYTMAKTLYDTISDDIDLAKRLEKKIPSLRYDPSIVGFGKRQGLYVGTVEKLTEDLIVQEANNISRVKSYGEFENEFFNSELNEWKQPCDKVATLYTTFHPKTHPILWLIMITQAILYQSLKDSSKNKDSKPHFNFEALKSQIAENKKIDWRNEEREASHDEVFNHPFEASKQYLEEKLKDILE